MESQSGSPVVNPCAKCHRSCEPRGTNSKPHIFCSKCKKPYHFSCTGVQRKGLEEILKKKKNWECQQCYSITRRESLNKSSGVRRLSMSSKDGGAANQGDGSAILNTIANVRSSVETVLDSVKRRDEVLQAEEKEMIEEEIHKLKDVLNKLQGIVEAQEEKLKTVEDENVRLNHEMVKMKKETRAVRVSLEQMRQERLETEIVISGLPESLDVKGAVLNLASQFDVVMQAEDIVSVVAKPMAADDRDRSIAFVRFVDNERRERLMKVYRERMRSMRSISAGQLSGDENDQKIIYINYSLTSHYQVLFKMARDLRRQKKLQFVWVDNGKLLVRRTERDKVHWIRHIDDFQKYSV
ncbi:hypothetical protein DMENIID0001_163470 [Sergentomyia squamirostris]